MVRHSLFGGSKIIKDAASECFFSFLENKKCVHFSVLTCLANKKDDASEHTFISLEITAVHCVVLKCLERKP